MYKLQLVGTSWSEFCSVKNESISQISDLDYIILKKNKILQWCDWKLIIMERMCN